MAYLVNELLISVFLYCTKPLSKMDNIPCILLFEKLPFLFPIILLISYSEACK